MTDTARLDRKKSNEVSFVYSSFASAAKIYNIEMIRITVRALFLLWYWLMKPRERYHVVRRTAANFILYTIPMQCAVHWRAPDASNAYSKQLQLALCSISYNVYIVSRQRPNGIDGSLRVRAT